MKGSGEASPVRTALEIRKALEIQGLSSFKNACLCNRYGIRIDLKIYTFVLPVETMDRCGFLATMHKPGIFTTSRRFSYLY